MKSTMNAYMMKSLTNRVFVLNGSGFVAQCQEWLWILSSFVEDWWFMPHGSELKDGWWADQVTDWALIDWWIRVVIWKCKVLLTSGRLFALAGNSIHWKIDNLHWPKSFKIERPFFYDGTPIPYFVFVSWSCGRASSYGTAEVREDNSNNAGRVLVVQDQNPGACVALRLSFQSLDFIKAPATCACELRRRIACCY